MPGAGDRNAFAQGARQFEARANGSTAASGRKSFAYHSLATQTKEPQLHQTEYPDTSSPTKGALASQLSREIVQLHARLYGRGPTKARSYLQGDYVLCVLEEIFTIAERTLIEAGGAEHVQDTRKKFQDAVQSEFIEIVERVTGRRVRVFLSQVDVHSNLALEFFLFENARTKA
jgi:uncharacterized protein YbcI